jgi:molecular chaperone DnaJ
MSALPDYYHILGVSLHADEREIKLAYRRLVRLYHPDVNKNPLATERFRAIQEAYRVLSHPQARYTYHQAKFPPRPKSSAASSHRSKPSSRSSQTNQAKVNSPSRPSSRASRQANEDVSDTISHVFESVFSFFSPSEVAHSTSPPPSDKGSTYTERPGVALKFEGRLVLTREEFERNRVFRLNATVQRPCQRCSGTGRLNSRPCGHCFGQCNVSIQEPITVSLPLDCPSQGRLVLDTLQPAGMKVRLDLTILECPAYLKREGLDVYYDLVLSVPEMILGGVFQVPGVTNKAGFKMTVPPCSTPEQRFRLPGKGLCLQGKTGDYFVQLKLKFPSKISLEEQALYRELLALSEDYVGHSGRRAKNAARPRTQV